MNAANLLLPQLLVNFATTEQTLRNSGALARTIKLSKSRV